jgi:hypothetical protein
MLLDSRPRKSLQHVIPHSERILIAEFDSNPVTTIIVAYSPTNASAPEDAVSFYKDLGVAIREVPAHNFLAIIGHINARLGPGEAPFTYHNEMN